MQRSEYDQLISEIDLPSNASARADYLFDECLEQFGHLLSTPAKEAIGSTSLSAHSNAGLIRKYFKQSLEWHLGAGDPIDLRDELNCYLGKIKSLDSPTKQKAALEALFTLPSEELNCHAGMKERMDMILKKVQAQGNLMLGLHEKALQKITLQDNLANHGIMAVHNVAGLEGRLLSHDDQRYIQAMQNVIEDELTGHTHDLLKNLDRVIHESRNPDVQHERLKKFSADYKQDIAAFFPPQQDDANSPTATELAELDTFMCQKRYFVLSDIDYCRLSKVNHDQIYGDLFTKLKGVISQESKLLLILKNLHMAAGLARGLLDQDTLHFFDIQRNQLDIDDTGSITAECNQAIIDKISQDLLSYCADNSLNCENLLAHDAIDMQQATSDQEGLQTIAALTNTHPKLAQLFAIRAITQGLNADQYLSIRDLVNPHLSTDVKNFLDDQRSYISQLSTPDDTNTAATSRQSNLQSYRTQLGILKDIPPVMFRELSTLVMLNKAIPLLESSGDVLQRVRGDVLQYLQNENLNPDDGAKVFQAVLESFANKPSSDKHSNVFQCKVIRALQEFLDKNKACETNLSLVKTLIASMSGLHAATLRKSSMGAIKGKLSSNQDPQTQAYKLVKKYLKANLDSPEKACDLLTNLWSGDTMQTLSQNTRTLSKAHWKKVATSVLSNGLLYGSSSAFGIGVIADAAGLINELNMELSGLTGTFGNLDQMLARFYELQDANPVVVGNLLNAVQITDPNIARYQQELIDQIQLTSTESLEYEKPTQFYTSEYTAANYRNPYNILNTDINLDSIDRENLSDGAKAYLDQLIIDHQAYAENHEELGATYDAIKRVQNIPAEIDAAETNFRIAEVVCIAPAAATEVSSLSRSRIIKGFNRTHNELKTWGPFGAIRTARTLVNIAKEKPLASVQEAASRLSPVVLNSILSKTEPTRLDTESKRVANTWETILSSLNNQNKDLPKPLKVSLLASAIKQFSINKPVGLTTDSAKARLGQLLDAMDNHLLVDMLPDLNAHSATATAVLVEYLLTKHEARLDSNLNGEPSSAGLLSDRNMKKITKIVENLDGVIGKNNRLNAKLRLIQAKHRVIPSWASPSVLISAAMRGSFRGVTQAVNKSRELEVARLKQKMLINQTSTNKLNQVQSLQNGRAVDDSQA